MSHIVDNAVIMCAGTSSRFAPLSYEKPKGLTVVKGEVLLERQIRQLQEAGVPEIVLVLGYRKEQFYYLKEKYGVILVENTEYLTRNNNSSIWAARDFLKNSYICSADNYFTVNPFERSVDESYYAAVYADGPTAEWCMSEDEEGWINAVTVGGENAWYMLGHVFWTAEFSAKFLRILTRIYDEPGTADMLWEAIFMRHLDELKMKIRRYPAEAIYEFDSLDELREFDESYVGDTRSAILKSIARKLSVKESELTRITAVKSGTLAAGFTFLAAGEPWEYLYEKEELIRL
ncbi:MAG: NTP transferase domain-containing protein [Lachnospiraceae bacterium]|nr:NTP transferase domain-containing protein [Lachnospiraceae bacterium]